MSSIRQMLTQSGEDADRGLLNALRDQCNHTLGLLSQLGYASARAVLIDRQSNRKLLVTVQGEFFEQQDPEETLINEIHQNRESAGWRLDLPGVIDPDTACLLSVYKSDRERFSTQEAAYLSVISNQLVNALLQASQLAEAETYHRLIVRGMRQVETQVAHLDLVRGIYQANLESEGLPHMLQTVAEKVVDLYGPAACYLSLWDHEMKEARLAASANSYPSPELAPVIYLPEIQTITFLAMDSRGMIIPDVFTGRAISNLAPNMKNVQSLLALPLRVGEGGLGSMILAFRSAQQFSDEYLSALEQVALAVSGALYQHEALKTTQRKVEESVILQRAAELINSSLEQDEVIGNILQQWTNLAPGESHAILLRRNGAVEVVAAQGESGLQSMLGQRFPISGVNPLSVVLHSGKPLKLKHNQGEYANLPMGVFMPGCTWLGVPLPYRDRVIGLLIAERKGNQDYQPAQVRLAALFAREVAAALEHARLYAAEQHRVRELNALQQATAVLLSTLNLEELLGQILDAAITALPTTTHGSIYLLAPQTGKLQVRAMYGSGSQRIHRVSLLASEPHVARAVHQRKPQLVPRIEYTEPITSSPDEERPQSAIIAPLLLRERVVGALFLGADKPLAFNEDNLRLLESFATTATEAIHNAMLHSEVKAFAVTDPLTGLYNRRGLFDFGEPEVERAHRFKRPLSILMFDIDRFKTINDQFGHDVGDTILREVGQRCRQFARSVDIVARFGGDEFVLLLLEADLHAAREVGQRVLKGIGDTPVHTSSGPLQATVSMGISQVTTSTLDLARLIKAADSAMYLSKGEGGNRITVR